ncbi:MAG: 3-dehydroquinate synthase [Paludibacteraceae bacterium]|nr:3-dehydroquinate synthase [Paludibacteraceae bacterium]
MNSYEPDQVCFVIDEQVRGIIDASKGQIGLSCCTLSVSESEKTLETVQKIWDFFFSIGLTRRGVVVAIGGGVLTDLVGFAAATYKRGVDYINVPTTLLAMVDASTGGKTGFNYHGLKNSIGVFAPPVETLIWPGWLQTLPAKEMLNGFAEMLKTGLIESPTLTLPRREGEKNSLWHDLLNYDLEAMPIEELTPMIRRCVEIKEAIVAADPKEEGLRKVLNFGHTFGHALEELSLSAEGDLSAKRSVLYQRSGLSHGYAVLYGMIAELYLSVTKLGCEREVLQQLTQIMLHTYGKPACKCSDRERLITLMKQDKKNERAAEINVTLLRAVGSPVVNQTITADEADEAWEYLFSL